MAQNDLMTRTRELAAHDPFREFRSIPGFSDIFEDFFNTLPMVRSSEISRPWAPRVDIKEGEKEYILAAALPGIKKEDVRITVDGDTLTISGERREEREEKGNGFLRRELLTGQFARSFPLPPGVHPEEIKAKHADGILTLRVPKPPQGKSRGVSVKVD
jgi:HSP20 family protein